MSLDRRAFLLRTGLALGLGGGALTGAALAGGLLSGDEATAGVEPVASHPSHPPLDDWQAVRDQFSLTPDFLHFGGLYIASHPTPVREAIERHRRGMDENP